MKLKDFLLESEEKMKSQKEVSLAAKMKEFYGVITRFEKNGEIHKDDKQKVETLKDFITDLVKQDDRRRE